MAAQDECVVLAEKIQVKIDVVGWNSRLHTRTVGECFAPSLKLGKAFDQTRWQNGFDSVDLTKSRSERGIDKGKSVAGKIRSLNFAFQTPEFFPDRHCSCIEIGCIPRCGVFPEIAQQL